MRLRKDRVAGVVLALAGVVMAPAASAQDHPASPPPSETTAAAATAEQPETILFIGNSFTYGGHSAAWRYRADSVTDLNGDGVGGVPALFKLFTVEAGLDYAVSLETSGGKTLGWHWDHRRDVVDRSWDHVVLQDLSTFTRDNPGDPATLIAYARKFANLFKRANPDVDISMIATWSRPDLTYIAGKRWSGQPITRMAEDIRAGYDKAKAEIPAIGTIHPVGQAFSRAIADGVADPDPYDGIAFGQIDLWTYDQYHASSAGYYLEALVIFADVTGCDPTGFGRDEIAASELGISPLAAVALQRVAQQTTGASRVCTAVPAQ
ncbi:PEP-CTERM sorting domain-containing protein [Sphingosinithalassobacter portus]|uniref:PEP-CTERM sorting domain-containing protein n=1 Tax=Stakelama portus TaxID=2676234 RepID=UPI000D6E54E4|nr:PEP-CTERM sorting domain-containing protein [Sphingosinithalassobacter portus]